jgi:hypothetical protein
VQSAPRNASQLGRTAAAGGRWTARECLDDLEIDRVLSSDGQLTAVHEAGCGPVTRVHAPPAVPTPALLTTTAGSLDPVPAAMKGAAVRPTALRPAPAPEPPRWLPPSRRRYPGAGAPTRSCTSLWPPAPGSPRTCGRPRWPAADQRDRPPHRRTPGWTLRRTADRTARRVLRDRRWHDRLRRAQGRLCRCPAGLGWLGRNGQLLDLAAEAGVALAASTTAGASVGARWARKVARLPRA